LNKNDRDIELRIGSPISPAKVQRYQDDLALVRYLRHRTYLLENRDTRGPRRIKVLGACPSNVDGLMAAEVAQLSPGQTLLETGEFLVLLAKAPQIPNVLHEIGRLREITFRHVGEGTGQAIDLDTFDDHYWHLFLWHRAAQQVVGAYRLGPSDEIVASVGVRGLYTWQLFAWKPSFLERIGPALELGRSFVRREYQRTYAPLLLLWRGIGQFLVANPRYKVLFGPVSISTDYGTASRQLMVRFLRAYRQSPELAPMVRARNPFRTRPFPVAQELVKESAWDIEELSALVSDIDFDRKGVPVLLKQYLRLGGELVAFNVDPNFANALDGLIVVDLRKTDRRLLVRYLGEEGAATFLA
jgi:putative hemolysin